MKNPIITQPLSDQVLMIGVYYKHHAPGGMASVVQYYEPYFETFHYIASWRSSKRWSVLYYALTALVKAVFRLVTDKRIKVLHIHTAADGSFWRKSCFLRIGKRMGKRVILHVHASRFKDFYAESSKKEKICRNLNMADRVIVLSESWKEWFESIGVESSKLVVLHNITAYPEKSEDREQDGKVHFLFLGEIGERKGVFDILRALHIHKAEMEGKLELRIGGNKNEELLIKTIRDYGLEETVRFEGWVGGEKKKSLLNWADVYILPSFNEGLPIGILEAMSYGCAVISTPVGGIPEVVKEGKNGCLVAPGNAEEIATAMLSFAEDRNLASRYGQEGEKEVETYLPAHVLQHLKTIYTSLL